MAHVHRIPAQRFVTTAKRPYRAGTARSSRDDLPVGESEIFSAGGVDEASECPSDLPVGQMVSSAAYQMCGRPGAGPTRSELRSRGRRPRIGSISRRRWLCSRKLAARRRMGLSNRFRASNQAARSGWRCRSACVAFSASLGLVPMPKDISRLWFKIRFHPRAAPIRAR
jgi:hypothetical protein